MNRKQQRLRRSLCWLILTGSAGALAAWLALMGTAIAGMAALIVVLAALLIGHRLLILEPGVAILTYHSVSPDPGWLPWSREIAVHPDTFRRHMQTLAQMGAKVLATRDLVAMRQHGQRVPANAVVLHFDDGYFDNWAHAVPVLRQHNFAGTFFASLDFIAPGDSPRAPSDAPGYMNWAELRAIEAVDGLEIEPHGVDHGRHAISRQPVAVLSPQNWRQHLWLQWAHSPGDKHDWFNREPAWAVPFGSPVPQSAMTLASRRWLEDAPEDTAALNARITRDLSACMTRFAAEMGRSPQIFCWPENKAAPDARRIAADLGYAATTGGRQRNCGHEPVHILSRIHIGDRALGFRWLPAEALYLRASVRTMQGNLYYYAPLAMITAIRALVFAWRKKFGRDFA